MLTLPPWLRPTFFLMAVILGGKPAVAAPESPTCRLLAASIRTETDAAKRQAKQKQYVARCGETAPLPKPIVVQNPAKAGTVKEASAKTRAATKSNRPTSKGSAIKFSGKRNRPKSLRRETLRAPPSVVTVPIYGSVVEAIERVADGGTVWVPAGSYLSPQLINKPVKIIGIPSASNKPVLLGRIVINSLGVEIEGFEIRPGSFEPDVNINLIYANYGAGVMLNGIFLNAEKCLRSGNLFNGIIFTSGSISIVNSNIIAGHCIALGISGGNVYARDTAFRSSDDYAIVQSGGISSFYRVQVTGISALYISNKAEMTVASSKITTKKEYYWWNSDGDDSHLYIGGAILQVNW